MSLLAVEKRSLCRPHKTHGFIALLAIALLAAGGCAAYRFGSASLYPADIQTVYVPMFQSDSYRRDLAERITEAVCKEIEKRTNYKVVNTPNADSVLSGRLLNDVKRIIVESPTDEPRESQVEFYLESHLARSARGAVGAIAESTPARHNGEYQSDGQPRAGSRSIGRHGGRARGDRASCQPGR